MIHAIETFIVGLPLWGLLLAIAASLAALGKGADLIVEEAVTLATRLGVSKVVIGATVVSLGTTVPEVSVSVMAAVGGNPELALGNAVGSIICDTGLILGLAIVIGRVPIERALMRRQGYAQLISAALLIAVCLPWSGLSLTFSEGGRMPQLAGFCFIGLLGLYLWLSSKWSRLSRDQAPVESHEKGSLPVVLAKIFLGLALVILASEVLIPAVEETARRGGVPDAVIAATLVAFGTSLPELVTAIAAVRKGHGALALGNVIGADVLNALFVAGASAAVTPAGLLAGPNFFVTLFPAMLGILLLFRFCAFAAKDEFPKWSGYALLAAYGGYLALSF